eukprot:scaffold1806_cov240-Pinguiococcus_pyrenoidosus.AAC.13
MLCKLSRSPACRHPNRPECRAVSCHQCEWYKGEESPTHILGVQCQTLHRLARGCDDEAWLRALVHSKLVPIQWERAIRLHCAKEEIQVEHGAEAPRPLRRGTRRVPFSGLIDAPRQHGGRCHVGQALCSERWVSEALANILAHDALWDIPRAPGSLLRSMNRSSGAVMMSVYTFHASLRTTLSSGVLRGRQHGLLSNSYTCRLTKYAATILPALDP